MKQVIQRYPFLFYGLSILLIGTGLLVGLMQGYTSYSPFQVLQGLVGYSQGDISALSTIVGELRFPRLLMAVAVGLGLSTSGVVMQSIFRNPMADPYILGISSGAALGIVLSVTLGLDSFIGARVVEVGAFLGALLVSVAMIIVAGQYGRNQSRFLMTGVALAAVCGGITGILIFIGAGQSGMDLTLYWMMGSIAFVPLKSAGLSFVFALVGFVFFMFQTRILHLMREGETVAITLGRPLKGYIRLYLLINAIMVAAIVMNSGIIGFVGLIVPHAVRLFVGANLRLLLPMSAILGMLLSIGADVIGRIAISGVDLPLGVIFAVLGAPLFMTMLIQRSR